MKYLHGCYQNFTTCEIKALMGNREWGQLVVVSRPLSANYNYWQILA